MQTKTHSLIESIANVAIGYFVALLSQIIIFPMFGIHATLRDNAMIGLWFTAISIVRSYVLRRVFTHKTERK
jgi:capsule polysaccharide modification protein KpsS